VPGLRRSRGAHRRAAPAARRATPTREDRVRLRDRLRGPVPALHQFVRLPRSPRPGPAGGVRHPRPSSGPPRIREHRRRRLLCDRDGSLDLRRSLQHEHGRDVARQQRVRPHQEPDLAHVRQGPQDQHPPPGRLARAPEPDPNDTRGGERLLRRADRRLEPGPPVGHDQSGPSARPRSKRPIGTRASRSSGSSSAAPTTRRRSWMHARTIRPGSSC
jgi:hypothetical protein